MVPSSGSLACSALALLLGGCSTLPGVTERIDTADQLAARRHWQPITLSTATFRLRAYGPEPATPQPTLNVYIEGDGLAWLTRSRPSADPTPIHPTGLALALADPSPHSLYLARPCQYLTDPACSSEYWLDQRFAPAVIEATLEALDQLKARYGAHTLKLTGYSGGAAVAALAAARRDDMEALITVAGNLDTEFWTRYHQLTPLTGSLNPADQAVALKQLPQWHFVGGRDSIIPPAVSSAYTAGFPPSAPITVILQPDYDHHCCWVEHWSTLLRSTLVEQGADRETRARK